MTIKLSRDLELFVHDAIASGFYAHEDDVIRDALNRLRQTIQPADEPHEPGQAPLTSDELYQKLFAAGLMTQLPDPAQDIGDDDDPPVEIEGEPLSETIIRERR